MAAMICFYIPLSCPMVNLVDIKEFLKKKLRFRPKKAKEKEMQQNVFLQQMLQILMNFYKTKKLVSMLSIVHFFFTHFTLKIVVWLAFKLPYHFTVIAQLEDDPNLVSLREYYEYKLQIRDNDESYLLHLIRLL